MDKEYRDKESLVGRLRKIRGQVEGIERMVQDERDFAEIIVQVSATRAALAKFGTKLVDAYLRGRLEKAGVREGSRLFEELVAAVSRLK